MKTFLNIRFIFRALLWAIIVHVWFVWQAFYATRRGGLIDSDFDMIIFFPHAILMFSLPPAFPPDNIVGNKVWIAEKLADAIPASLVYGLIIALLWNLLARKLRNSGNVHQ